MQSMSIPFRSYCVRVDNRSAYTGAQRLWEDSDLFASACATSWRIHRNEGRRAAEAVSKLG